MIGPSRTGLPLPQCLPTGKQMGHCSLKKERECFRTALTHPPAGLSTLPLGLALGSGPGAFSLHMSCSGLLGTWMLPPHKWLPPLDLTRYRPTFSALPAGCSSSSQEENQNGQAGPRQWRESPEGSTVAHRDVPAITQVESRDRVPPAR